MASAAELELKPASPASRFPTGLWSHAVIYFERVIIFRSWEVIFLKEILVVVVMKLIWDGIFVYNIEHIRLAL